MKQLLLLGALVASPMMAQQVELQAPTTAMQQTVTSINIASAQLEQGKVVAEIASGKTGKIELVMTEDGRLCKRLTRYDNTFSLNRHNAPAQLSAAASLYQDFSSWDGATLNWIPADWSEINSQDTIVAAHASTYSWACDKNSTGFLAKPVKGDWQCSIYFGSSQTAEGVPVYAEQDEWLISPAFTPAEGEKLRYALSFTPFWMLNSNYIDWDTFEFTQRERTASVQTYLKEGDGEWTLIYDPYEDYKDKTMDELMDDGLNNAWRTYTFDMTQYVGKSIQIAFRYVGTNGENWSLDYASCAVPSPVASYVRPGGAYLFGFSDDYSALSVSGQSLLLVPGDTDITWTNTSNEDAETFLWSYDYTDEEPATSTDVDLTVNYPTSPDKEYDWYALPSLEAKAAGAASNTYAAPFYCLQAGGYAHYTFSGNTEETLYGVGNYNIANKFSCLGYDAETPLYGISEKTDTAWTKIMGADVQLTAIGNYFEKPETEYLLHGINVLCGTSEELAADAELTLVLRKVSNGRLSTDTMAVSICTGADAKLAQSSSGTYYYSLPFTFTVSDNGFDTETDLTISDAFIAFIELKTAQNISSIRFWHSYYPDELEEANGYFMLNKVATGKQSLYSLAALQTSLGQCYSSFLFNLDMTYPDKTAENIEAISNNSCETVRCYNLAGQQVGNNAKGFVIEQSSNGIAKKFTK